MNGRVAKRLRKECGGVEIVRSYGFTFPPDKKLHKPLFDSLWPKMGWDKKASRPIRPYIIRCISPNYQKYKKAKKDYYRRKRNA